MPIWDLQASAGAPGMGINWRDAWSAVASYNPHDAVAWDGDTWISLTNNQGIDPATDDGTNWSRMTEGATCEVGTTTTGAPGTSASVVNVGTPNEVVLNFTIPRGDIGASGSGSGNVVGPGSAVVGQIVLFDNGTGTLLRAALSSGIVYVSGGVYAVSPINAKGDIFVGSAANALTRKAVGANGHLLFPNSAQSDGLEWRAGAKADVGLANVDNTSDANKPISTATQTALNLKQDTSAKGNANGYAALDATGKVPTAQLPPAGLGDVVGPASSVDGEFAVYSGTTGKLLARLAQATVVRFPRGHLQGLVLSVNATDPSFDIDVTSGECRDSSNTDDIVLSSSITKQLDAVWAAGTNQGGRDAATPALGDYTHWHMFLIKHPDTGVVDALFSSSATAPTMPAGYTLKRRIGSFVYYISGGIFDFVQTGDEFLYKTPTLDYENYMVSTSAVIFNPSVPKDIRAEWFGMIYTYRSPTAGYNLLITNPDVQANIDPNTIWTITAGSTTVETQTFLRMRVGSDATGSRLRVRSTTSNTSVYMITHGWIDERGRNGYG